MRSIVEYLKQDKDFDITEFKIIDKNNEDILSSFGKYELLKAVHELNKLRNEDPRIKVINNEYDYIQLMSKKRKAFSYENEMRIFAIVHKIQLSFWAAYHSGLSIC